MEAPIKFYHSIRFRVVAGVLIFGALLITLNFIATLFIMGQGMDRMITNFMDSEADSFLAKYQINKNAPLPNSRFIQLVKGLDGVPQRYKPYVRDLQPGNHRLSVPSQPGPFHVVVIQVSDSPEWYYMIFKGRTFFQENLLMGPRDMLGIFLAMILIPGTILGALFSRALFAPVKQLMEEVRKMRPDNIPEQFTHDTATNEIGMISRTLQQAMGRIREFIRREKQFTRDASHELRTPLTVIKGAVEIMEKQKEIRTNPRLEKPLERIRRSAQDMEALVETFLWLAREGNTTNETARVEPQVQKAVADHGYLLEGKPVEVIIRTPAAKTVPVKEEVLYIVVANLIRNAFQFTARGRVEITLEEDRLIVADTGPGMAPDQLDTVTQPHIKGENSPGFGLGLSIVHRFCNRFGWELSIQSQTGQGTRVSLLWQPRETPPETDKNPAPLT